jgi:translocation and assembly module TamB
VSEQPSTQIPNEPGFRLLRTLILCLAGILLLVLLLLGSLSALLSTERGSQWLLGTATGFIPEQTLQLQFADSQGTFLRGLSLYDVQITMGENRITINELRGRWNPFTLLSGEFILDSLIVQGLEVNWQGGDPDDTADTTATDLSSTLDGIFPLPVTIRLTEFAVTDVIIRFNDIELDISTLRFAAVLRGRDLHLDTVHFDGLDALVDGDIVVELGGNYAISAAVNWQYSDLSGGAAAISGDLNQLTLQHQLQEPLLLDSDGSLTLGVADLLNARSDGGDLPLSINLTHSLPEPRLPFEGLEDITFSSTQINTRGWLDELQIDGTTGIETDRLPGPALQAELQWRAVYSDSTVTIEEFIATTVSGRLQTSGLVALQDVTRISLSLELDENDPASYLDAIPEMLSISGIHVLADLELEIAESGPRGTVTV